MTAKKKPWETYEQVAVYLLDQVASRLGLESVEGKQKVVGDSGATWEIDGKGIKEGEDGFIVLECRRTKSRQKQEQVAAIAFRISDIGATGGIIVSPVELQKGAAILAASQNITKVHMDKDSTRTEYVLKFLNEIFVGVVAEVKLSASMTGEVIRNLPPTSLS